MPFKITDEQVDKMKKQLKVSYDMYEKTKSDTRKKMKASLNSDGSKKYSKKDIDERIKMIDECEKEIVAKYTAIGGTVEELAKKTRSTSNKMALDVESFMSDYYNNPGNNETTPVNKTESYSAQPELQEALTETKEPQPVQENDLLDSFIPSKFEIASDTNFDMVTLPSRGECYRNKTAKVPVAYLNAFDENVITAPNLYRDNAVIDTILTRKIMNNTISCDDMLEGDRDAIILFLRATGFGTEYPITVTDNATGKEFDTTIDLSTLKYKPFKLVGDQNGWFDFTLPISKKTVKFRFLTHRDVKLLDKVDEAENSMIKRDKIKELADTIDVLVDNDTKLSDTDKLDIRKGVNALNRWKDSISEDDTDKFTHTFTNALELSIMSIDSVTDRNYIRNFVRNMNIRDSSALNKYINENEPGIDYHITVQRPESLGGGSTTVFLQIDQYLFLNVSERL